MINRSCKDYFTCDHVRIKGSCDGCGNADGAVDAYLKKNKWRDEDYIFEPKVGPSNGRSTIQQELYKMIHKKLDPIKSKATYTPFQRPYLPGIKNVIFSNPATIVLWSDGTKTVVKCQENDIYDPEKGLAMAISKKALGNKGNFNEVFKKLLPTEIHVEYPDIIMPDVFTLDGPAFSNLVDTLIKEKKEKREMK